LTWSPDGPFPSKWKRGKRQRQKIPRGSGHGSKDSTNSSSPKKSTRPERMQTEIVRSEDLLVFETLLTSKEEKPTRRPTDYVLGSLKQGPRRPGSFFPRLKPNG